MGVLSSAKSSEPVKDWATVLSNTKSVFSDLSLDFHPPEILLCSKKTVKILADDVSSITKKWNCALVAQILGDDDDNSSLNAVKKFANSKWNDWGLLQVQKLDNGLFVFRFKSEESKNQVLKEEELVFYGSKMMYLRPWVPNKQIEKLTLENIPIWIKLRGLGLQYFSLQALSKLGSLVGRPLFADKDTIDQSMLTYARICVEIKADDELPNVITFENEFGITILQDVEYEWVPPRCSFCKLFGHDTNFCAIKDVLDLEAEDDKMLPEINADNEEVDLKAVPGDEERSDDNKNKTRFSRIKACPCGSTKKYKACCGSISGKPSCNNEEGSQEKKGLVTEEKRISRNKACRCGSKKKYRSCCKLVAGGSNCKDDEAGSQDETNLLPKEKKIPRNKPCPCGSVKKYKKCCGATCKKKISKNKKCPCGSTKKYDECCGSIAEDVVPTEEEWIICN